MQPISGACGLPQYITLQARKLEYIVDNEQLDIPVHIRWLHASTWLLTRNQTTPEARNHKLHQGQGISADIYDQCILL